MYEFSKLQRYGLWRDEEGISTDLVKAEEKEQRRSQVCFGVCGCQTLGLIDLSE